MDKQVKKIPEGYHTLTPYLITKDAAKAIDFYKQALGAEELFRVDMSGRIGHAEVQIGDSRFMIADEFPDMRTVGPQTLGGTPVSFMVYVEDVDAVAKKAVAAGMKIKKPVENQFYGDRTGTFEDPFGHVWSIGTHIEDVSHDEMKKRLEKRIEKSRQEKH